MIMTMLMLLGLPPVSESQAAPSRAIGLLSEQFDQKCSGYEAEWVNPHAEIGFSRISPASGVDWKSLIGKPVVAVVRPVADGNARPLDLKEGDFAMSCVPMQMRSDWIPAKDGIRMLRSTGGPRWQGLEFVSVAEFTGLKLRSAGNRVEGTLENSTDFAFEAAVVEFHYEGCYGKPGHVVERVEVGTLKPGQKADLSAGLTYQDKPGENEGRRGHDYFLTSVQLYSVTPNVIVDLDIPLSYFGLSSSCPK